MLTNVLHVHIDGLGPTHVVRALITDAVKAANDEDSLIRASAVTDMNGSSDTVDDRSEHMVLQKSTAGGCAEHHRLNDHLTIYRHLPRDGNPIHINLLRILI